MRTDDVEPVQPGQSSRSKIITSDMQFANSQAARAIQAIMLEHFAPSKACAKLLTPVSEAIATYAAQHYLELYNLVHLDPEGRS